MDAYLYIVISSTPYRMGKAIRRFTREPYNHVSISLDPELTQMYGFARRYFHTPFYGGFVRESTSRYRFDGQAATIRLCRIPVTGQQYQQVKTRLETMYGEKERYLYNYFSALAALFRRRLRVQDSYTCIEFATEVLWELGLPVDPEKYYSVGDLEALLRPYAVYTGAIPDTADYDAAYYGKKPVPHPVLASLRSFFALFPRLGAS